MSLRTPLELTPKLTARRDARIVAKILSFAEIGAETDLGLELVSMLSERIADCRDLFALRGVRTRRSTLVLMAARSLARDKSQWARLDALKFVRSAELLTSVAFLVERLLAPEARLPRRMEAKAASRRAASFDPSPLVAILRDLHGRGRAQARTASVRPSRAPRSIWVGGPELLAA